MRNIVGQMQTAKRDDTANGPGNMHAARVQTKNLLTRQGIMHR
jgi:hypothetical protein